MIRRNWPGIEDVDVLSIEEPAVLEFVKRIEHFSATRFNAMVSMLKGVLRRCQAKVPAGPGEGSAVAFAT